MRVPSPPVNDTTKCFPRTLKGLRICNAEESVAVHKYKCKSYKSAWLVSVGLAVSVLLYAT